MRNSHFHFDVYVIHDTMNDITLTSLTLSSCRSIFREYGRKKEKAKLGGGGGGGWSLQLYQRRRLPI